MFATYVAKGLLISRRLTQKAAPSNSHVCFWVRVTCSRMTYEQSRDADYIFASGVSTLPGHHTAQACSTLLPRSQFCFEAAMEQSKAATLTLSPRRLRNSKSSNEPFSANIHHVKECTATLQPQLKARACL